MKGMKVFVILMMLAALFCGCDMEGQSGQERCASDQTNQVVDENVDMGSAGPVFPLTMGNAENLLFTDTGRIFVSGANIAEITGDGLVMLMPSDFSSSYGGIAQVGPYLYVVCNKNYETMPPLDLAELLQAKNIVEKLIFLTDAMGDKVILRADLRDGGPDKLAFTVVHHFEGMMIPNGMAADSKGNLYIADETFLPQGKIVKVSFSDDENPVSTQDTWLSVAQGVLSPNGMCMRDDVLYFTDFNINAGKSALIKKVAVLADGTPGEVITVYAGTGLYDDLDAVIYKGKPTVAAASFFGGNIHLIDEETGTVTRAGNGLLQCPSSAHFGNGGWIGADELIVTEVGILSEPYSGYGNRVSVIPVP